MVCHQGKGAVCISKADVADHLAHGDILGSCGSSASTANADAASLKVMPNPFNNTASLEIVMENEGNYTLELRNKDGFLIGVLAKGTCKAGEVINVELNRGNLPDGVYYGRLITENESKFVRIMLMR